MPLQDHFHPPLSLRRHWHAFHNAWSTYIASALNQQLPPGYFAEPNVQFGIEIDVGTFEEANRKPDADSPVGVEAGWIPPAPMLTVPLPLAGDIVEIGVFHTEEGPTLVGAVELVSPSNKDRPEHSEAFVSKCVSYLQQGIGLVIVDVVTDRRANMHMALLARLAADAADLNPPDLYAVSYRPVAAVGEVDQAQMKIWRQPLAVGHPLGIVPLWLRGGPCLRLDLDATYERTCQEQRVQANGM